MHSKANSSHRIDYLDGLRGVAALIVVLDHYFSAFLPWASAPHPPSSWALTLQRLLDGNYAVFIFFLLSGFVLAQSSAHTKSSLATVLVARYLRLTVPMLLCLILAWFWVTEFSASRMDFQARAHNSWLVDAFYTSPHPPFFDAVKDGVYRVYLTGYSRFDGPVWTMRKELIGSVAVYLLYLVCPVRFRWPGLALFAVLTLGQPRYLTFPLGVLLRELWVRGRLNEGFTGWLALLLSLTISAGFQPFLGHGRDLLLSIAAGLLVFSVITLTFLRRILSSGLPRFLGRISFALYLVHLPLVLSLMAWGYLHISCPPGPKFVLGLVVFLTVSIVLAWLITLLVDEPLVKSLHRLKKVKWRRVAESNPTDRLPSAMRPASNTHPSDTASPSSPT